MRWRTSRIHGLLLAAFCLVVIAGCRQEPTLPPVHVTTDTWNQEVLQSPEPVLVDFSAEWCGPCQQIAPVLARVAYLYQGRAKVVSVDVDESPELANLLGIKSMPTFIVFKQGEELRRQAGVDPSRSGRDQLSALIDAGF